MALVVVVVTAGFPLVNETEKEVVTLEPLVMEEMPPDTVVAELLALELEELPVAAVGELRLAADLPPEMALQAVVV